jgi:hypothetical protein
MKVFLYKDELHLRVIPVKKLFNSTMVHEVVNRGDVFAVRLHDQALTIIPGKYEAEFFDVELVDSLYLASLENITEKL